MNKKINSADNLSILNDQSFSPEGTGISMTIPGPIGLKLQKSGSGSMRHHLGYGHSGSTLRSPIQDLGEN